MKRMALTALAIIVLAGIIASAMITRDGETVTPQGEGTISLDAGTFEAFPLPDYVAKSITDQYKSYLVEVEPGIKVHVLEVGEGFPVFLQHGNPTSGLLYRRVAAVLPTDRLRLIMPTLVGLGFSSKVPASLHTLENHTRWINGTLTRLGLRELVYVGQDWGGPVGMGALAMSPGLIKGAVVLNTGFNAPREKRDLSRIHALVKTPILGELLVETLGNPFVRLPDLQGDPTSMADDVVTLYARPVIESGNRKAPLAMMRMVPDSPDHPSTRGMQSVEDYVESLDVPVEIVWGMSDPILGPMLPVMRNNFPHAPWLETNAGHFLQEEVPGEIAAALLRVVDQIQTSKGREE